jgi:hypothetical protein
MVDPLRYPGTPRWVKVFGIIAIGVVLLVVILLLTGGPGRHGPGRHRGPGAGGGQTSSSSDTEHRPDIPNHGA